MAIHEMLYFPRTRIVHRLLIGAVFLIILFVYIPRSHSEPKIDLNERERRYPLVWKHIHLSKGSGGGEFAQPPFPPDARDRDAYAPSSLQTACAYADANRNPAWYIPPSWLPKDSPPAADLVGAAWLASTIANQEPKHHLKQTSIPRIIHQTWKGTDISVFPEKTLEGVEKWLGYATAPETEMAYFMWNDDGVRALMQKVETGYTNSGQQLELADLLPKPVELADVFRVVVCNTIGGVVR